MKFSIVFNSRERPQLLRQMLEHVRDYTHDISQVEVLINFDNDDDVSKNIVHSLQLEFPFFTPFFNDREISIHVNVNKLANLSSGKYIWGLGDDCHIITPDWDRIAYDAFESYLEDKKDGIAYGAVECTSIDKVLTHGWYCSAPIISRKAMDTLGFLTHADIISFGVDVVLYRLYSSVNRVIDLRHIVFDHVNHNSVEAIEKTRQEKLYKEYTQRHFERQGLNPWAYDITADINTLNDEIDQYV